MVEYFPSTPAQAAETLKHAITYMVRAEPDEISECDIVHRRIYMLLTYALEMVSAERDMIYLLSDSQYDPR